MRWVVLVLGILGSSVAGFLAYQWFSDYQRNIRGIGVARAVSEPKEKKELQKVETLKKTSFFLMGAPVMGLFGGILAFMRRRFHAAIVLVLAWAGPLVLLRDYLMDENAMLLIAYNRFTGAMLLGGLLALFIRPPKPKPALETGSLEENLEEEE